MKKTKKENAIIELRAKRMEELNKQKEECLIRINAIDHEIHRTRNGECDDDLIK